MKKVNLGKTGLQVPAVAVGCMRMNDLSQGEAERFLSGALDMDAVFFDHADIYGAGKCEEMFGKSCSESGKERQAVPAVQMQYHTRQDV